MVRGYTRCGPVIGTHGVPFLPQARTRDMPSTEAPANTLFLSTSPDVSVSMLCRSVLLSRTSGGSMRWSPSASHHNRSNLFGASELLLLHSPVDTPLMDVDPSSREPDTAAAEDRELVEGCIQGDHTAQRRLYDRYADRVYAVVLRMLGNREEAIDLSQDIFLRVFEKIGDFRGDSALGTWIHRVAVNMALHYLRGVRRGRAATERLREKASPYADSSDPDLSMDVEAVLAGLPDEDRAIVLLRYQQDLTYAEIAEVLDIPMGTVGSRLNRIRAELKARMTGYAGGTAKTGEPEVSEEG